MRRPRATPTRCSASRATPTSQIKKAFRTLARELHPDVNTEDPEAEEKFKEAAEAYEILSDPERRATYDRFGHEGLRSGGYQPNFDQFGSLSDLFEAFFGGGGGGSSAAASRRGRPRAATSAPTRDRSRAGCAGGTSTSPTRRSTAASTATATAPSRARRSRPASAAAGAGQLQAVTRTPFGQMMRTVVCDTCGGDGRVAAALPRVPRARAQGRRAEARRRGPGRHRRRPARAHHRPRSRRRGGAPARRPLRARARARGRALRARGRRPRHRRSTCRRRWRRSARPSRSRR